MKYLRIAAAFVLSSTVVFIFLTTAPPRSHDRIIIVYLALILFDAIVFIYRIIKRTFKKNHRESIGMFLTTGIASTFNDIPIVLRATGVSLIIFIFVFGHLKKNLE